MQHFLSKALFISLVLIGLASCSGDSEEVKKAFYYWKASDLNNYESHFFEEANAEKLYVKIFEITNDDLQGAIPIAKSYLKFPTDFIGRVEIIPCVFVENEVIEKSTNKQLNELAENTVFLVNKFIDEKLKENQNDELICNELLIEIFRFEKDILDHSRIEDNILIPQIRQIQNRV